MESSVPIRFRVSTGCGGPGRLPSLCSPHQKSSAIALAFSHLSYPFCYSHQKKKKKKTFPLAEFKSLPFLPVGVIDLSGAPCGTKFSVPGKKTKDNHAVPSTHNVAANNSGIWVMPTKNNWMPLRDEVSDRSSSCKLPFKRDLEAQSTWNYLPQVLKAGCGRFYTGRKPKLTASGNPVEEKWQTENNNSENKMAIITMFTRRCSIHHWTDVGDTVLRVEKMGAAGILKRHATDAELFDLTVRKKTSSITRKHSDVVVATGHGTDSSSLLCLMTQCCLLREKNLLIDPHDPSASQPGLSA
ncbi:hypothetical protein OUZ56_020126 [Daphnia magna]|uniref:Uncharacterized protein n=1 Tax=Daphnia magna TaxID=35525 RepID=A0ABQ9ZDL2_9CRUS|nr:hypothetical protein OUZ56_020126 [Daphnia magna]